MTIRYSNDQIISASRYPYRLDATVGDDGWIHIRDPKTGKSGRVRQTDFGDFQGSRDEGKAEPCFTNLGIAIEFAVDR